MEPVEHTESDPVVSRLCGQLEGDIDADGIVLVDRGSIRGDIEAAAVVVDGEVHGDISADLVVIAAHARIHGRVRYGVLRSEPGGEVCGTFEHVPQRRVSADVRRMLAQQRPGAHAPSVPTPAAVVGAIAPIALTPPLPTARTGARHGLAMVGAGAGAAILLTASAALSSTGDPARASLAAPALRAVVRSEPPAPEHADAVLAVAVMPALAPTNPRPRDGDDGPRSRPLADAGVADEIATAAREAIDDARAIGEPNAGRLRGGVAMPEGESWRLRRRNHYGTQTTIASLVDALEAYGRRFPDAPAVVIGDISARNGGKLGEHKSHQNGRDVDVRFVLLPDEPRPDGDATRFRRRSAQNFDGEKNWFLIRTLIDGGNVEAIFISSRVQAWVREAAARELPASVVDTYFERISHEPGHTGHMHVRFAERGD